MALDLAYARPFMLDVMCQKRKGITKCPRAQLHTGVYTQTSNRRHNRMGHLIQGRYKAILVAKESYLLELARYKERKRFVIRDLTP